MSALTPTTSHRNAQGRRRGSAMIVTILVSVAMTALAVVAVTTTSVETQLAQNHKMLKQAQYVAETGMMVAIQRLQSMGSSSILRERERRQTMEDPTISMSLRTFGEDAVFRTHEDPQLNSFGPEHLELDFLVEVDSLRTTAPPPGYQINLDQQPQSLELGLMALGRVGQLSLADQEGMSSNVTYSAQKVWALVPIP